MTRLLAALGALLSILLVAPPAVATAPDADPVVYYNLGSAEVKPTLIFTAYSSSPTMKVRRWKHWGEARAVVVVAKPDQGEKRRRYRLSTGCAPA